MLAVFLALCVVSAHALSASKDFPSDFLWGAATAAYQIEGAYDVDGKGPSIWDQWSKVAGHTHDGDTGDVADDSYHRFEEDLDLLSAIGFSTYRFSISWTRIIPTGRFSEGVNKKGLDFYRRVLDACKKRNLTPLVTLFHWDTPLGFFNGSQSEPVGWLREEIIDEYVNYATLIFQTFPQVPYYLTFNEPLSFVKNGYGQDGTLAPGRWSNRTQCLFGNSAVEPYIAGHHVLLAHARAVAAYRSFNLSGKIGITLDISFAESLDSNVETDLEASERSLQFQVGWWAGPIFKGDYPRVMREQLGNRLPQFSEEEKKLILGSHDFYGCNHYTSSYVTSGRVGKSQDGWSFDQNVTNTHYRNKIPIGVSK